MAGARGIVAAVYAGGMLRRAREYECGFRERLTGVEAADLYTGADRTLYVVAEEQYKSALAGSSKAKRELLREQLGHPVEIIAAAETAEGFVSNVFAPFKPDSVEVIEAPAGTIVHVSLPLDTKGRAIGKGGSRLAAARELIMRAHDVKELVVT